MIINIQKLYPHFTKLIDRRQYQQPVELERRSDEDRRESPRVGDSKLKTDVSAVKDTFKAITNEADKHKDLEKAAFVALSPITPVRRITSLPDNVKDENYPRAAGLLALAVVNLPEDTRDLKTAWKQVTKGELPKYDYKEYQQPFSFLKGTLFESMFGKMGKFGAWLCKKDITLYDINIGGWLEKKFKFKIVDAVYTGRVSPWLITDKAGKPTLIEFPTLAVKLSGSTLAKTVGRALLRIPLISAVVLLALELPIIIKETSKPKDLKSKFKKGTKQILKSIINVTSILTGISLGGSILAKKGPAGSLAGMGLGSIIGICASKQISRIIDKLTT